METSTSHTELNLFCKYVTANDLGSNDLSIKHFLIREGKGFSTSVQIGLHPRNFRALCFEGASTPCSHYKNGRQELSRQCFASQEEKTVPKKFPSLKNIVALFCPHTLRVEEHLKCKIPF